MSACSSETEGPAETGWAAVRNPVHSYEDAAIKDAFVVRRGDTWHFGFSYIRDDPFRFRLGLSTTRDLRSFDPLVVIDQPEVGGLASPDVVQAPGGGFVMTYNSHTRDVGDAQHLRGHTCVGGECGAVELAADRAVAVMRLFDGRIDLVTNLRARAASS